MNIYLLLVIILFLLILSYYASQKDIMAPSVLLTAGYLISCMSCIYNNKNWGVNLHFFTCFLITLGIICFQIGDYLCQIIHRTKPLTVEELTSPIEIKIPLITVIFFTLYSLLVLYLTVREILTMTGGIQSTLGKTIGKYRYAYSYTDFRANTLNVQLLKVSKGAAYTFLYAFFNNIIATPKTIIKNATYLFPIIIFAIITLIKGGRINAMMLLIDGLFLSYYVWHKKVGWNKNISLKYTKRIFITFVVLTSLFFGTRELVGRQETTPFMEYLTTYLGGSFQLLDQFLVDGIATPDHSETFPGIIQSLDKIGIVSESHHKSLEFRFSPTGVYLGNVYTGLRRFYHDFGMTGVIIIQILYGYLFSLLYFKIKSMKYLNSNRLFFLITYASLLFCTLTESIEDHFWIDLSLGFVVELVVVYLVTKFIMDFQLRKNMTIQYKKWDERNYRVNS